MKFLPDIAPPPPRDSFLPSRKPTSFHIDLPERPSLPLGSVTRIDDPHARALRGTDDPPRENGPPQTLAQFRAGKLKDMDSAGSWGPYLGLGGPDSGPLSPFAFADRGRQHAQHHTGQQDAAGGSQGEFRGLNNPSPMPNDFLNLDQRSDISRFLSLANRGGSSTPGSAAESHGNGTAGQQQAAQVTIANMEPNSTPPVASGPQWTAGGFWLNRSGGLQSASGEGRAMAQPGAVQRTPSFPHVSAHLQQPQAQILQQPGLDRAPTAPAGFGVVGPGLQSALAGLQSINSAMQQYAQQLGRQQPGGSGDSGVFVQSGYLASRSFPGMPAASAGPAIPAVQVQAPTSGLDELRTRSFPFPARAAPSLRSMSFTDLAPSRAAAAAQPGNNVPVYAPVSQEVQAQLEEWQKLGLISAPGAAQTAAQRSAAEAQRQAMAFAVAASQASQALEHQRALSGGALSSRSFSGGQQQHPSPYVAPMDLNSSSGGRAGANGGAARGPTQPVHLGTLAPESSRVDLSSLSGTALFPPARRVSTNVPPAAMQTSPLSPLRTGSGDRAAMVPTTGPFYSKSAPATAAPESEEETDEEDEYEEEDDDDDGSDDGATGKRRRRDSDGEFGGPRRRRKSSHPAAPRAPRTPADGAAHSAPAHGAAAGSIEEGDESLVGISTDKAKLQAILATAPYSKSTGDYLCPVCTKGFKKPVLLKSHLKMHDPQKSHQCDYCDRTFLRAHDKHRHVRSIHMEKKQFVCPTCGAQFARSDALRRHTGRDNTPCYGKVAKGKKGVRLVTIIPEAVLGAEPRPKQPERRAAAPAAPAAPVLPFKLDPPRPGKRRRRAWDDEDSDGSEGGSEAASPAVRGSDRDGVYD